jgi:choline dehydrogenase-like flavoprotein
LAVRELRLGPGTSARASTPARPRAASSTRSGTAALEDVCDPDARVTGAPGLVFADASLIPTIPRTNTNVSVIAVAEAVADRLRVT